MDGLRISYLMELLTVLIGELMNELFVQDWHTTSNYSNYFSVCVPVSCQYSFIQRRTFPNIITVLLGIYGGLTIFLCTFSPLVMNMYQKLRAHQVSQHLRNPTEFQ